LSGIFDTKDEMIITELKNNARHPIKNIAVNINVPRVTIHDRIQKMMR